MSGITKLIKKMIQPGKASPSETNRMKELEELEEASVESSRKLHVEIAETKVVLRNGFKDSVKRLVQESEEETEEEVSGQQ